MTDKQLIARLLELQEHPEQMTDEQLRQMLNDEQMHELVEQMAFTKRAFKNEESLIGELPIADEWEKFATAHAEELTNSARAEGKFTLHFPTHKIAASFIGVVLASSIALAAIHIVRQYQKPETPQTTDTIAVQIGVAEVELLRVVGFIERYACGNLIPYMIIIQRSGEVVAASCPFERNIQVVAHLRLQLVVAQYRPDASHVEIVVPFLQGRGTEPHAVAETQGEVLRKAAGDMPIASLNTV